MPLFARCPYCGHGKKVPDDSTGMSARCPKCRQPFVVVPENLPVESSRTSAYSAADGDEFDTPVAVMSPPIERPPAPISVPVSTGMPLGLTDWSKESPKPDSARIGAGVWVLVGLAAVAAVSAGVAASVTGWAALVIPLAAAGVILGGIGLVLVLQHQPSWMVLAIPGVTTFGSALILLLALFAPDLLSPQYDAGQQKSTFDPELIEVVPIGGELVDPGTLGSPDAGADASRAALQQGPVRVRVTGVTVGPVELDTAKPTSTKERYTIVSLQIQHVGHGGPVTFSAWGATVPKPIPDAKLSYGGKSAGQVDLGSKTARGKLYHENALPPSVLLSTKLVFEPLPGKAEPFTLELPAEAWGKAGVFRFRIPASMVQISPKK